MQNGILELGQVDFITGQVTFHSHLLNGRQQQQQQQQQVVLQLNKKISKPRLAQCKQNCLLLYGRLSLVYTNIKHTNKQFT